MAKNLQQDGTTLDYENTSATLIESGQPVAVGGIVGVAHADIPQGRGACCIPSGCLFCQR